MTESLAGARVLILEDEFFLADDLARALRDAGGEPVGPVATIEQAEAIVARERLDGAILDLNLRGEMASDFADRLAAREVPCVIVSGYGEDGLSEPVTRLRRLEKPVEAPAVIDALKGEIARVA